MRTFNVNGINRSFPILQRQPYPLLFVTLSGSHLYGFSSPDSDYDLRGVHVATVHELLSLRGLKSETIEEEHLNGFEDELVTHEVRKYFSLLAKNNGYVLEQIFSPLVLHDCGILHELRQIATECITSNHHLHYKGFGYGEWKKFVLNPTKHVKRILYVFRVLMTGINLMETGKVESNIFTLNERFKLPYIPELVEQKQRGYEKSELAAGHTMEFYTTEYNKLETELIHAAAKSHLPKEPKGVKALEDLLWKIRQGAFETNEILRFHSVHAVSDEWSR